LGGYGSGWHRGARLRCERRVAIDLSKHGLEPYDRLTIGWHRDGEYFGAAVVVDIRGNSITYHVCDAVGRFRTPQFSERADFVSVKLRFGSRRFLLCPGCNRPCRILYSGRERLLCRLCLDLSYASQNMGQVDRIWKQVNKLNRRVDPTARLVEDTEFSQKPPRMRWTNYLMDKNGPKPITFEEVLDVIEPLLEVTPGDVRYAEHIESLSALRDKLVACKIRKL
jgi:hypothetical protein